LTHIDEGQGEQCHRATRHQEGLMHSTLLPAYTARPYVWCHNRMSLLGSPIRHDHVYSSSPGRRTRSAALNLALRALGFSDFSLSLAATARRVRIRTDGRRPH